MKRIFRLPVLAGVIVMAAVLASLTPATSSHVYAQVTVYYYPYGQGPYGGYGQVYAAPYRANSNMFPSNDGRFDRRDYGYSDYGYAPPANVYRYNYGPGPYVRVYGRTTYYQPTYGPVYVPYGY